MLEGRRAEIVSLQMIEANRMARQSAEIRQMVLDFADEGVTSIVDPKEEERDLGIEYEGVGHPMLVETETFEYLTRRTSWILLGNRIWEQTEVKDTRKRRNPIRRLFRRSSENYSNTVDLSPALVDSFYQRVMRYVPPRTQSPPLHFQSV